VLLPPSVRLLAAMGSRQTAAVQRRDRGSRPKLPVESNPSPQGRDPPLLSGLQGAG